MLRCLLVDKLLNPCNCKDIWSCQCRHKEASTAPAYSGGLDVLANAATLCTQNDDITPTVPDNEPPSTTVEPPRSCCQLSTKSSTSSKRKGRSSPSPTPPPSTKHRGPSLPPIYAPLVHTTPSTASISTPIPEFPTIPSLSSVAALAGSGCTCGFRCTCPGCVEHRGPQHASQEHGDCTDGNCATCVDYEGGVGLPTVQSHHSTKAGSCCGSSKSSRSSTTATPVLQPTLASSGVSFIDSFFARTPAVALPPAPPQRARRGTLTLDPTDTTIYPSMLFAGGFKHLEERGPAFGLVSVPKLQCCAGKCGCPDGSCGCDHSCGGCAGDLDEEDRAQTDGPINSAMSPMSGNSSSHIPIGIRSCCSSKK